MSIDLFQTLPDLDEQKLHTKYKILRDHLALSGEWEILRGWCSGFVDRDNKIIKEFQTSFHSALWEIFLHAFLKEAGCEVDYSKNRPDFIVTSPRQIFIEAVVSEVKKDGRKEETRGFEDLLDYGDPLTKSRLFEEIIDEAITRHSNSIRQKLSKYSNEYAALPWVDENAPFVIALGSYDQLHYGKEFSYSMMPLLYGKRYHPLSNGYYKIDHIVKPGTSSPIPVGVFEDASFSNISAIIFSCTVTLGKLTSLAISQGIYKGLNGVLNVRHDYDAPHFPCHLVHPNSPEYLSDGVFVFFNSHAKNPLPRDSFGQTNAVSTYHTNGGIFTCGNNLPIVQRFNYPWANSETFVSKVYYDFNSPLTSRPFAESDDS
jgi:hypothetical protein